MTAPCERQIVLQIWVSAQPLQAHLAFQTQEGLYGTWGTGRQSLRLGELHLRSSFSPVPAISISARMDVSGGCGRKFNLVAI